MREAEQAGVPCEVMPEMSGAGGPGPSWVEAGFTR